MLREEQLCGEPITEKSLVEWTLGAWQGESIIAQGAVTVS